MLINLKVRRRNIFFRLISLVIVVQLLLNDVSYALAPTPGSLNPAVRREAELLDYVIRGRLIFSSTAEDERFLKELNHADALLLSHGKILAAKELKKDPLKLIRKIIHEEIEAILQIMAREDRAKYSALMNMVLSQAAVRAKYYALFPQGKRPNLANELLANDILATAFELLIPKQKNLIEDSEITPAESAFLRSIEPLINAGKHNYFTGMFWDPNVREAKIRIAMANGMSFTQVASPTGKSRGASAATPELRPIEQLSWEDEAEVLGHFRAALAEFGWPLPRVIPIDGKIVDKIIPKPLNIASLKKLAEGKSPKEYLDYLAVGNDFPEFYFATVVPFRKEFATMPDWSVWFRYKDQLKRITEYVKTLPKNKPVKIVVHAVWQGEDAYAIAIALKHFYPDRIFEITGVDFIKPDPQELNWVYVKRIPEYLKEDIRKYFTYKTKDVVALKDEWRDLVTLKQGDMENPDSFGDESDIVVINGALGQSITNKDDIIKSIENARTSLRAGGRFYTDNSAYRAHPEQKTKVDEILENDFVKTGKFKRISETVFEKVNISTGKTIPPKASHARGHVATFYELFYGLSDNAGFERGRAHTLDELRAKVIIEATGKPLSVARAQADLSKLIRSGLVEKVDYGTFVAYASTLEDVVKIHAIHAGLSRLKAHAKLAEVQEVARKEGIKAMQAPAGKPSDTSLIVVGQRTPENQTKASKQDKTRQLELSELRAHLNVFASDFLSKISKFYYFNKEQENYWLAIFDEKNNRFENLLKFTQKLDQLISDELGRIYGEWDKRYGIPFRYSDIIYYYDPSDYDAMRESRFVSSDGVIHNAVLINLPRFIGVSDSERRTILKHGLLHEAGHLLLSEIKSDSKTFTSTMTNGIDHHILGRLQFDFNRYNPLTDDHIDALCELIANWFALQFQSKEQFAEGFKYQLDTFFAVLDKSNEQPNLQTLASYVAIARMAEIPDSPSLGRACRMLDKDSRALSNHLYEFLSGLSLEGGSNRQGRKIQKIGPSSIKGMIESVNNILKTPFEQKVKRTPQGRSRELVEIDEVTGQFELEIVDDDLGPHGFKLGGGSYGHDEPKYRHHGNSFWFGLSDYGVSKRATLHHHDLIILINPDQFFEYANKKRNVEAFMKATEETYYWLPNMPAWHALKKRYGISTSQALATIPALPENPITKMIREIPDIRRPFSASRKSGYSSEDATKFAPKAPVVQSKPSRIALNGSSPDTSLAPKKPHARGHVATFYELLYGLSDNAGFERGKAHTLDELRAKVIIKTTDEPLGAGRAQADLSKLIRSGLAKKVGSGYASTLEDNAKIRAIHKGLSKLKAHAKLEEVQEVVYKEYEETISPEEAAKMHLRIDPSRRLADLEQIQKEIGIAASAVWGGNVTEDTLIRLRDMGYFEYAAHGPQEEKNYRAYLLIAEALKNKLLLMIGKPPTKAQSKLLNYIFKPSARYILANDDALFFHKSPEPTKKEVSAACADAEFCKILAGFGKYIWDEMKNGSLDRILTERYGRGAATEVMHNNLTPVAQFCVRYGSEAPAAQPQPAASPAFSATSLARQWQRLEKAMRKLIEKECECQEMALGFLKDFYARLTSSKERKQLSRIARILAAKQAIAGHTFFLLEQHLGSLKSPEERRLGFRLALLLVNKNFGFGHLYEYLRVCFGYYVDNKKERLSLIELAMKLAQNGVEPDVTILSLEGILPNVTDEKERSSIYSFGSESAKKGIDPFYALGELYTDRRKEIAKPLNKDERKLASKTALELVREGIDAGPALFSMKIILGKSGNNLKVGDLLLNMKSSFLRLHNNLKKKGIALAAVINFMPFMFLGSDGSEESVENIFVKTEQDVTDIHNSLKSRGVGSVTTLRSLEDIIVIISDYESFANKKVPSVLESMKKLAEDGLEINENRKETLLDYYDRNSPPYDNGEILKLINGGEVQQPPPAASPAPDMTAQPQPDKMTPDNPTEMSLDAIAKLMLSRRFDILVGWMKHCIADAELRAEWLTNAFAGARFPGYGDLEPAEFLERMCELIRAQPGIFEELLKSDVYLTGLSEKHRRGLAGSPFEMITHADKQAQEREKSEYARRSKEDVGKTFTEQYGDFEATFTIVDAEFGHPAESVKNALSRYFKSYGNRVDGLKSGKRPGYYYSGMNPYHFKGSDESFGIYRIGSEYKPSVKISISWKPAARGNAKKSDAAAIEAKKGDSAQLSAQAQAAPQAPAASPAQDGVAPKGPSPDTTMTTGESVYVRAEQITPLSKDEIVVRLSRLKTIIDKPLNDLTDDDKQYLLTAATHFDLYPHYLVKEQDKEEIHKYAESLYILTSAELTSLDLPDAPLFTLSAIDEIGNDYFVHELGHLFDDMVSLYRLSSWYKGRQLLQHPDIQKEIDRIVALFQGKYRDENLGWRLILERWKGIRTLKPKVISALIDGLAQHIEGVASVRADVVRYITEHRDEIGEEIVGEYLEEAKISNGECKMNLMQLGTIKQGILQSNESTAIDINEFIQKASRPYQQNYRYEIQLDLASNIPQVNGNAVKVGYIWTNLFRNSVDAICDVSARDKTIKGSIDVKTHVVAVNGKEYVEITVGDNGMGIPESLLQSGRLFQKGATTKKYGNGLGLYLIKQTVEELGGTISVQSEVGKGTTFTIRLPLAQPPAASPAPDGVALKGPSPETPLRTGIEVDKILAEIKRHQLVIEQDNARAQSTPTHYDVVNTFNDYVLRLELLHAMGILRGRVLYPCMGNDYFPSYFATTFGINNYTGIGKEYTVPEVKALLFEESGLPLKYGDKPTDLIPIAADIFDYDAYFPRLLNSGGINALLVKDLTTWAMHQAPSRALLEEDVWNLVQKISKELLQNEGFIIIANENDLWLADRLIQELGYSDLLADPKYAGIKEALNANSGSYYNKRLGYVQISLGRVPISILQKPAAHAVAKAEVAASPAAAGEAALPTAEDYRNNPLMEHVYKLDKEFKQPLAAFVTSRQPDIVEIFERVRKIKTEEEVNEEMFSLRPDDFGDSAADNRFWEADTIHAGITQFSFINFEEELKIYASKEPLTSFYDDPAYDNKETVEHTRKMLTFAALAVHGIWLRSLRPEPYFSIPDYSWLYIPSVRDGIRASSDKTLFDYKRLADEAGVRFGKAQKIIAFERLRQTVERILELINSNEYLKKIELATRENSERLQENAIRIRELEAFLKGINDELAKKGDSAQLSAQAQAAPQAPAASPEPDGKPGSADMKGEGSDAPASAAQPQETLQRIMLKRFEDLKQIPVKAVAFDIDGNLTDVKNDIPPEALDMIISLRELNVPVLLISARKYDWDEATKAKGALEVKEVLLNIQNRLSPEKRSSILEGLFVACENGLASVSNGFLKGEEGYKNYDMELFKTLGIVRDAPQEERLKIFFESIDLKKYGISVEWQEPKEHSFAFVDTSESRRENLGKIRSILPQLLKDAGLWNDGIRISESDISAEVSFYRIDKSCAFEFFDKILGMRDDDKGVIVSAGDNGQKGGNDNPLVAGRKGGLSSNRFDADNMIALKLISGQTAGFPSLLWAMRQLKYINSATGTVRAMPQPAASPAPELETQWQRFVPDGIIEHPAWEDDPIYRNNFSQAGLGSTGAVEEVMRQLKYIAMANKIKIPDKAVGVVLGFGDIVSELSIAVDMFGLRKVHGVEWSGERVKSGAKQLLYEKRSPEQLILHHADMNNLKEIIPSGSVGVVQGIGLAVFPYDDTREIRESLAREIVRILEPGGVALLATKGYNLKAVFEAHGRLFRDGSYTIFQKEEKDAITSPAAPQPPALPVQRIEITMPSDGLPEEITFTSALKGLENALWQEFGAKAGEAFTVASAYERNGQSLILYADDILQNAMVVDLEHAVKNILAKHNVLGGGKILFYARNDVNATILDRMVKRADPSIETIRILQKDLQTNGDELKETEALLRAARSKGAKELLGIIRGPSQKPEELAALAKGASVPIVIVGPEKGVYSFTQAIAMAMDAKLHNGATNGWLIMLPPVRALTDDIIRQYNEYQASLQALQAA